jgi:hypothetical protein
MMYVDARTHTYFIFILSFRIYFLTLRYNKHDIYL